MLKQIRNKNTMPVDITEPLGFFIDLFMALLILGLLWDLFFKRIYKKLYNYIYAFISRYSQKSQFYTILIVNCYVYLDAIILSKIFISAFSLIIFAVLSFIYVNYTRKYLLEYADRLNIFVRIGFIFITSILLIELVPLIWLYFLLKRKSFYDFLREHNLLYEFEPSPIALTKNSLPKPALAVTDGDFECEFCSKKNLTKPICSVCEEFGLLIYKRIKENK